jgi:hypothetical protein
MNVCLFALLSFFTSLFRTTIWLWLNTNGHVRQQATMCLLTHTFAALFLPFAVNLIFCEIVGTYKMLFGKRSSTYLPIIYYIQDWI